MTPQWITAISAVIALILGIPGALICVIRLCQIEKNTRKPER
jgi:hypothetical protein